MSAELCVDCRAERAGRWHRCDECRRVYWHLQRQQRRDERELIRTILASRGR